MQDLTPNWITVRVTLKTAPLEQWAVAREMRQRIKARFDHEGIEFAHPTGQAWGQPGLTVARRFCPDDRIAECVTPRSRLVTVVGATEAAVRRGWRPG